MSRSENGAARNLWEVVLETLAGIVLWPTQLESAPKVRRLRVEMDERDINVRITEAMRRDFEAVGDDLRAAKGARRQGFNGAWRHHEESDD